MARCSAHAMVYRMGEVCPACDTILDSGVKIGPGVVGRVEPIQPAILTEILAKLVAVEAELTALRSLQASAQVLPDILLALRKIASCQSKVDGDVVDIARRALAEKGLS